MRPKLLVDPAKLLKELHFYNPDLDLTGVKAYLFDALIGEDAEDFTKPDEAVYGETVQAQQAASVPRSKPRTLAEAKGLPDPLREEVPVPPKAPVQELGEVSDADLLKDLYQKATAPVPFESQAVYEDEPAFRQAPAPRTSVGSARTTTAQPPRTVTKTTRIAPPRSAIDPNLLSHYESQASLRDRDDERPSGGKRYSDVNF